MLTVENIVDRAGHDIWAVNVEEEYHEESSAAGAGSADRDTAVVAGRGTGRAAPILPKRTS
jgi:hypothetical protein